MDKRIVTKVLKCKKLSAIDLQWIFDDEHPLRAICYEACTKNVPLSRKNEKKLFLPENKVLCLMYIKKFRQNYEFEQELISANDIDLFRAIIAKGRLSAKAETMLLRKPYENLFKIYVKRYRLHYGSVEKKLLKSANKKLIKFYMHKQGRNMSVCRYYEFWDIAQS